MRTRHVGPAALQASRRMGERRGAQSHGVLRSPWLVLRARKELPGGSARNEVRCSRTSTRTDTQRKDESMIARHEVSTDKTDIWALLSAPLPEGVISWRQDGRAIQRDGKFFARFVAYIEANTVR